MRKRGLKDVKRRNRQVIVETIMESGGLSRVEIAQETELAASTVSTLVGELLAEGILTEAGTVVTAGRSRTELTVNPEYGSIAVIGIGRRETSITYFNMALKPIRTEVLSKHYVSGNDLLELIIRCIHSWQEEVPAVMGIGLLFQEDMRESDFRVMYSTGFSSASITLRDALVTQYRVPVLEEYSLVYTVTNALARETDLNARNSAHISVGSRVLANITLEGREVPVRSSFCEELLPELSREASAHSETEMTRKLSYLSNLIALLCILFPLDTVFLSGSTLLPEDAIQELQVQTAQKVSREKMPQLRFLRPEPVGDGTVVMARQVLRNALMAR